MELVLFIVLILTGLHSSSGDSGFCMYTVKDGKFVPIKPCQEPDHESIITEIRASIQRGKDSDETTTPSPHSSRPTFETSKFETESVDSSTVVSSQVTHVVVGHRTALIFVSFTAKGTNVLVAGINITNLVAVDYDPVEKHIYWAGNTFIFKANATDKEGQIVVSDVSMETDGIAVDWVARNLYWADKLRSTIEVSRLDGSSRKVLISTNITFPRAIALDPGVGNMYWSDWGTPPKIEAASLNGEDRRVLVNESLMWPNGIALDYKRRLLYWADAGLDRIEEIGVDGTGRKLLSQFQQHIFGFTYLNDFLYWTDWLNGTMARMFVPNKSREGIFGVSNLMGIKAYGDTLPQQTNGCAAKNGGCSHLCLYTPRGVTCHCQDGYAITSDTKTCTPVAASP